MPKELLAAAILNQKEPALRSRVEALLKRGVVPTLAIVWVGNNPSSEKFIRLKTNKAVSLGIRTKLFHLKEETEEKELAGRLEELAKDPEVHGIIIQLPLPAHLEPERFIRLIPKKKDVDGLRKDSPYLSPAARGVIELILQAGPIEGKTIAVVGQGRLIGEPLKRLLPKFSPQKVFYIDKKTKNPQKLTRQAEIVVSATGVTSLIDESWLKEGAILIDASPGDFHPSALQKASFYTPKVGALGPLTIFFLLENTTKAAESFLKENI